MKLSLLKLLNWLRRCKTSPSPSLLVLTKHQQGNVYLYFLITMTTATVETKQLTRIVQTQGFILGQKFAHSAKANIAPGKKVSLSAKEDCRFVRLEEGDDIHQFRWDRAWQDWEDEYGDRAHDYTLILLGRPGLSEYSTALLFEQLDDAVYKGIQSVLG